MSETQVMGFHYKLKDPQGLVIDSSQGKDPLLVMVGRGHIVAGLDAVLPDMNIGDKRTVVVAPEDGYGAVNEELRLKVRKDQFPPGTNLKKGDQFQTSPEPGAPVFTVIQVENEFIYIDGNHPLAGVELHFDIEITEKRAATPEELDHGHAHVGGSCGH